MTDASRGKARPGRLTKRSEFLAAAKGRRFHTPLMSIQAAERQPEAASIAGDRFGLTVSRKVGTASERNRVKRRLRAALRAMTDEAAGDGARRASDYVIIARRDVLAARFPRLVETIKTAMAGLARPPRRTGPRPTPSKTG